MESFEVYKLLLFFNFLTNILGIKLLVWVEVEVLLHFRFEFIHFMRELSVNFCESRFYSWWSKVSIRFNFVIAFPLLIERKGQLYVVVSLESIIPSSKPFLLGPHVILVLGQCILAFFRVLGKYISQSVSS